MTNTPKPQADGLKDTKVNNKEINMSKLTKEQTLAKIQELKKYVDQVDVDTDFLNGIAIKSRLNESIIYQSTKPTLKEAVIEAVEKSANLSYANLRYAKLSYAKLKLVTRLKLYEVE